jgi:hypothetical protein
VLLDKAGMLARAAVHAAVSVPRSARITSTATFIMYHPCKHCRAAGTLTSTAEEGEQDTGSPVHEGTNN